MKEVIHIHDRFDSAEDFRKWERENQAIIWSPSRLGTLAACPRKYQHRYLDRLSEKHKSIVLSIGSVMHSGLHVLYVSKSVEEAIARMREVWTDTGPLKPEDQHLSLAHLEVVINNYSDYIKRHSSYKPVNLRYEDLNTEKLIAARWIMTDDGLLVLGESLMLMNLGTEDEPLYIKGIPDLPVETPSKNMFVMDHKTTSGWISPWWSMKYRISDQFRLYCIMIKELVGRPVSGAVVDAIYVGKYATSPKSKATKFDQIEYIYDESMLEETLENARNQQAYAEFLARGGYYPQSTGLYCGGCPFLESHCKHPIVFRDDNTDMIRHTSHHSMLDPRPD